MKKRRSCRPRGCRRHLTAFPHEATGTSFSHRLLDKYLDYLLSAGPAQRQQPRSWGRCEGLRETDRSAGSQRRHPRLPAARPARLCRAPCSCLPAGTPDKGQGQAPGARVQAHLPALQDDLRLAAQLFTGTVRDPALL